jgi:hypothetical protein
VGSGRFRCRDRTAGNCGFVAAEDPDNSCPSASKKKPGARPDFGDLFASVYAEPSAYQGPGRRNVQLDRGMLAALFLAVRLVLLYYFSPDT